MINGGIYAREMGELTKASEMIVFMKTNHFFLTFF